MFTMKTNYLILFLIFLFPLQDLPIPGLSMFYTKALSLLLLGILSFFLIYSKKIILDRKFSMLILFLLLISNIDYLIASVTAGQIELCDLVRSILEILLFLSVYNLLYTFFLRNNLKMYLRCILLSFTLIILPVSLAQIFAPSLWKVIYKLIHSGNAYDVNSYRIFSTYTEPSWFTSSLLLTIVPAIYSMILTGKYIFNRFCIWILFFFVLFLIIVSTSRIGVVGTLIVLLVGVAYYIKTSLKKKLSLVRTFTLIISIIVIVLSIFSINISRKEIETLTNIETNYSNITRLGTAIASFNIFKNYPWGIGFHNFHQFFNEEYLPSWALISPEIQAFLSKERKANPKNMYSRLLVESGIIGFLLYFTSILNAFLKALKLNKDNFIRCYILLSFCSLLIIYFNTDSFMLIEPLLIIAIIRVGSRRVLNL